MTSPFSLISENLDTIDSLCIGSGRFLRSVLVPALANADYHPCIVQTRGRSFLDCALQTTTNDSWTYEVDTVHYDGRIETSKIPFWGAGTLGSSPGKKEILDLLQQTPLVTNKPFLLGVGVTEAGLANASTQAVQDLYVILKALAQTTTTTPPSVCVLDMDNIPKNGTLLRKFMTQLASDDAAMMDFLEQRVTFHNTMVDRITSQRPDSNGLVPRAEPTPLKALVIEDLQGVLPDVFSNLKQCGVVVRKTPGLLDADIALKLRVANGTHTAAAHTMALLGFVTTDVLSSGTTQASLLMKYLDSLFDHQILQGALATTKFQSTPQDIQAVYDDWRQRLIHAHFGLSTFFITQNGAAKGGIRIGPTVRDLIRADQDIRCSTAFAVAALLRFLTSGKTNNDGTFVGALDQKCCHSADKTETIAYTDGLSYNLKEGWYTFRCDCQMSMDGRQIPLPIALSNVGANQQPVAYTAVIREYLCTPSGGNLSDASTHQSFDIFVQAISTLYARMVGGDSLLDILQSLDLEAGCESLVDGPSYIAAKGFDSNRPLHYRKASIPNDSMLLNCSLPNRNDKNYQTIITAVVVSEVASAVAVDLHTHLLPPKHGALCLWGIDELLTYHYLVAEYFVTAPPSVTPQNFYAQSKQEQANLLWKALFVDRSPVSEACRGVITTCVALGLSKEIQTRDLEGIRNFYRTYRDKGPEGAEAFSQLVFDKAGIEYAVMTNIPFEPNETQHWRPTPKEYSTSFRSACRVDPLLAGNKSVVEQALLASGYETTLEGARQFLHDWCDTMQPEYLMASTPHNFVLAEDLGTVGNLTPNQRTGVNEEAMREPFAFANLVDTVCGENCGDELASVIDEDSDLLCNVLMKVCEERDLPLALKIGAHRGVNPNLLQAGDGVVAFADASVLARLCTRFPKVRFLATFLSRTNQHEACVLASKFRNLHLYGCWWFCNNPSIIRETTTMRIEMLGTAFTAQHSDSRVLDQLLYKWAHSRAILAEVFLKEYTKLIETGGWIPTRGEIRRDVRLWFGGSYEDFLSKSLV